MIGERALVGQRVELNNSGHRVLSSHCTYHVLMLFYAIVILLSPFFIFSLYFFHTFIFSAKFTRGAALFIAFQPFGVEPISIRVCYHLTSASYLRDTPHPLVTGMTSFSTNGSALHGKRGGAWCLRDTPHPLGDKECPHPRPMGAHYMGKGVEPGV